MYTPSVVRPEGMIDPDERRAYARFRWRAAGTEERTRRNALHWAAKKKRQEFESDEARARRRAAQRERQRRCRAAKKRAADEAAAAPAPATAPARVQAGGVVAFDPALDARGASREHDTSGHDIRRANFRTHRGIPIMPSWVDAAKRAFELTKRRPMRGDPVEGDRGRYGVAIEDGEWVSALTSRRAKGVKDAFQEIVAVMTSLARKEGFHPSTTVAGRFARPQSLFIRPYSAGGARDELPRPHHDTLDPGDGTIDKTPVVSVIFVLSGGRSESGVDVEAYTRSGTTHRPVPLFLDTGVVGILGNEVKHRVVFTGEDANAPPGGWSSRLTVVAFFKRDG